jgi:hypothetical protein
MANPNPRHDGDLICAAARDGDLSHVSALLARGVPPDARESQFGSTPLHWSGQARRLRARRVRACACYAARSGKGRAARVGEAGCTEWACACACNFRL